MSDMLTIYTAAALHSIEDCREETYSLELRGLFQVNCLGLSSLFLHIGLHDTRGHNQLNAVFNAQIHAL